MTAYSVLGFGEETEMDFFNPNRLERHVKLEIWTTEVKEKRVASAIMEAAHVGRAVDGTVSIEPVDEIFRIRTKQPTIRNQSGSVTDRTRASHLSRRRVSA